MVNVESGTLRGGGQSFKRKIWDGVKVGLFLCLLFHLNYFCNAFFLTWCASPAYLSKPILEEWTGMELEPSSMYGIRMYTEGGECVDSCINFLFPNLFLTWRCYDVPSKAVLNPHADRIPLISSCIINVAQDVDSDWPLEVYGRVSALFMGQFDVMRWTASRRRLTICLGMTPSLTFDHFVTSLQYSQYTSGWIGL